MDFFHTRSVADRLALTLDGLCRAVAARIKGGALAAAVIVVIWTRVKRTEVRIQKLLVRFRAGALLAHAAPRVVARGVECRSRAPVTGVSVRLPRRLGWLLPLVPYEAANFSSQLRVVLVEPEMQALLAASGAARRCFAPLCRMLGIEASVLQVVATAGEESDKLTKSEPAGVVVRVPREPEVEVGWGPGGMVFRLDPLCRGDP